MKNAKRVLVLLVAALCLALVGCTGVTDSQDDAVGLEGAWRLCGWEGGNGALADADFETLEQVGFSMLFEFEADGTMTGSSLLAGVSKQSASGTWDYAGGSAWEIFIDGDAFPATYESGLLRVGTGDETAIFEPIDPAEADALKALYGENSEYAPGSGVSATDFTPVVVLDGEEWLIEVVGKRTDDWGDCGYDVKVANRTNDAINVLPAIDQFTVDGQRVEFWGGGVVEPNAEAVVFMYAESNQVPSLENLVGVTGAIEVRDANASEVLATCEVDLP